MEIRNCDWETGTERQLESKYCRAALAWQPAGGADPTTCSSGSRGANIEDVSQLNSHADRPRSSSVVLGRLRSSSTVGDRP